MGGLGKDVTFLRALVTLKVQRTVVIDGFYAVRWPIFIESKMGLKPVEENMRNHSWVRIMRGFQKGTESINP